MRLESEAVEKIRIEDFNKCFRDVAFVFHEATEDYEILSSGSD